MNSMLKKNMKQNLNKYGKMNTWNTINITDMSEIFKGYRFDDSNDIITNWNVSNVVNMHAMFEDSILFNQNLSNWNTSNVTDMSFMFSNCRFFNMPFNKSNNWFINRKPSWNTSNVVTMSNMFGGCDMFNQPLNYWDVSNVFDMTKMFEECYSFNQPLNNWNVSNVTNMECIFIKCNKFNQPLNNWNVSKVTNMKYMFFKCKLFNQPLNNWNVSNVTNMYAMFSNCECFNQPLNKWDVSKASDISYMFFQCKLFNQDLNDWTLNASVNIYGMFINCDMLRYHMKWDNGDGKCPHCYTLNDDVFDETKYKEQYNKQKEISKRIQETKYSFHDDESDTDAINIGFNPISRQKVNIRKWLEETPTNIIITNETDTYCVSKIWIQDFSKSYIFIECDESGKRKQIKTKPNTNDNLYMNLNIVGIEPTGIIPMQQISQLLSSPDNINTYRITNTGQKLFTTLMAISSNTVLSNSPTTIHDSATALYIPRTSTTNSYVNTLSRFINEYTYQWDRRINGFLNSGKTANKYVTDATFLNFFNQNPYAHNPQEAMKFIQKKIKKLDELFTDYAQISDEPLVVYRGIITTPQDIRFGLNKAFVSTTTTMDVAFGFLKKNPCCILELTITPGIPFLSAKAFSKFPSEDEIILPRNLIYTLKSHTNNIYKVDVTMSVENQFYQGWNCHENFVYTLEPTITNDANNDDANNDDDTAVKGGF